MIIAAHLERSATQNEYKMENTKNVAMIAPLNPPRENLQSWLNSMNVQSLLPSRYAVRQLMVVNIDVRTPPRSGTR